MRDSKHFFLVFLVFILFLNNVYSQTDIENKVPDDSGITVEADSTILIFAEEMPSFKGDYSRFLKKNLRYPEDAMKNRARGKSMVKFVVEKDGSISNVTSVKSEHPYFDEEALRVVKLMDGQWKPGKHNGQIVRCWKYITIEFVAVFK